MFSKYEKLKKPRWDVTPLWWNKKFRTESVYKIDIFRYLKCEGNPSKSNCGKRWKIMEMAIENHTFQFFYRSVCAFSLTLGSNFEVGQNQFAKQNFPNS